MLCPKCGKGVGDSVSLCATCQMEALQSQGIGFGQTEAVLNIPMRPAGFWLRFLASFADAALVAVITLGVDLLLALLLKGPLSQIIQGFFESVLGFSSSAQSPDSFIAAILLTSVIAIVGVMIVNTFVWVAYHTLFEVSPLGGSPGKAMVGLRVTTENGEPITITRSFLRNIAKIFSMLSLGIGYISAGFTIQKQALHDILTGSVVNASLEMPGHVRAMGSVASVSLFFAWYVFLGNPESLSKITTRSAPASSYSYSSGHSKEKKSESKESVVITNENIGVLSKQKGLAGIVRGQSFIPSKVLFSPTVQTLNFRTGSGFLPDQEITIFLFTDLKELPGKIFKVGRDTKGLTPHIHIASKTSGNSAPERKIFTKNYALYLRIHGISGKIISGEIKLLVPGAQGAKLAGSFKATIE